MRSCLYEVEEAPCDAEAIVPTKCMHQLPRLLVAYRPRYLVQQIAVAVEYVG